MTICKQKFNISSIQVPNLGPMVITEGHPKQLVALLIYCYLSQILRETAKFAKIINVSLNNNTVHMQILNSKAT